jgi:hypothetical protein
MTANVGTADSALRILAAVALGGLAMLLMPPAVQVLTLFLACALVVTGARRSCPVYRRLRTSTSPLNRRLV